jgi:hypothetical protein
MEKQLFTPPQIDHPKRRPFTKKMRVAALFSCGGPNYASVAMGVFGLHEYIKHVTRRLGKLGAMAV